MASARIFGVIISKFSHWQKPGLIIRLEINKSLKIGFHGIVLLFGLAISLRMKGIEKPMLDAGEVTKQSSAFWGKKKASICDNWVRKAVVMHYHVHYNLCKSGCIDGDLDQFIVDHLCEPINNDYNKVVTVSLLINWYW